MGHANYLTLPTYNADHYYEYISLRACKTTTSTNVFDFKFI